MQLICKVACFLIQHYASIQIYLNQYAEDRHVLVCQRHNTWNHPRVREMTGTGNWAMMMEYHSVIKNKEILELQK